MAGKDLFQSSPVGAGGKRPRHEIKRLAESSEPRELQDMTQKSLKQITEKKDMKKPGHVTVDSKRIIRRVILEDELTTVLPEDSCQSGFPTEIHHWPKNASKVGDKTTEIILQSRSKKYPYVKSQMLTTQDLKKPKTSSVGVVPVRSSWEIDDLKVMIQGQGKVFSAEVDEIDMARWAQDAHVFSIQQQEAAHDQVLEKLQTQPLTPEPETLPRAARFSKPAILSSMGTISAVPFMQRAKPAPKPAVIHTASRQASTIQSGRSAKSRQSVPSSLLSDDLLLLPEETIYSKYDDAIATIDVSIDTAISSARSIPRKCSESPALKSVQKLVEEARRISSPTARPLYLTEHKHTTLKNSSGSKPATSSVSRSKQVTHRKGSREHRKGPAKAARKDTVFPEDRGAAGDFLPKHRSVEEIVAALKQQASSGVLTEADKKIEEIMQRVMSRTDITDADIAAPASSPASETAAGRVPPSTPDTVLSWSGLPSGLQHVQDSQDYWQDSEPEREVLSAESAEIRRTAPWADTVHHADELQYVADPTDGDTTDASAQLSFESLVVPDADEETPTVEEEEITTELINIQQAWEDLLAPSQVTYEELLSVTGEALDFHTRGLPGASTDSEPSVSFLSTWTPSTVSLKTKDQAERSVPEFPKHNIHHFCRMTSHFQLPREFRNTGRKYHTPDRFSGVFPQQPYRFIEETLQAAEKDGGGTHLDSAAAAAQRIVTEANQLIERDITLEALKAEAEKALSSGEILISGQSVLPISDESRVYWAPAPAKMEVAPATVQQVLFPEYQRGQVDQRGQLLSTEPELCSDSEQEEEMETPEQIERREQLHRILKREHHSSEDLTKLMKMEIKREMLIRDKLLDVDTYRPLISPQHSLLEEEPGVTDDKILRVGVDSRSSLPESSHPMPSPCSQLADDELISKRRILGPYDDQLFAPVYFPPPRRTASLPRLLAELDDTLMVPFDFNTAMDEIREQRLLIEKAKCRLRAPEAGDELVIEVESEQQQPEVMPEPPAEADILQVVQTPDKEEEPTPAEVALLAGRKYVIFPRKKKSRIRRPLDTTRLEAIKEFLSQPPNKLTRHSSLPKITHTVEQELRVPQRVRSHEGSLPDLLDFEQYKTAKHLGPDANEREWVRGLWNKWFDEIFPPESVCSENETGDDLCESNGHSACSSQFLFKEDDKNRKDNMPEILSEEIDVIDPVDDAENNAEIISILREEVEKLSQLINSMTPPMAFDLARRGALYRKLGFLHKAKEDLNRAILMEPMLLDAYWHRHLLYVLLDKKAEALDDLNYIMKHNKNHAGAYRSMAEIYRKQGDYTMAVVNYTQAIKLNPKDHQAYFQRAQVYEQRGEKLLALEDYSHCMKLMPTRTDAIIKHGLYYFHNENWTSAVTDFTELLRVDPLNALGRLYRGRAYAKLKQWGPAVEDLSAAIHLHPNHWEAFFHRACILRKAHPKRALQDYSVALLINDGEENILSYLHRGILYNDQGRPEDAIADFEAVLKLNKDVGCAHVNLGLIFMTKHINYHRAIKRFTSAIKVDPTYVRAYICRGEAYHKLHELKLALKDFTRAIHLSPVNHHYYMYRGQLVLELGNLELAAFCIRHASELEGESSSSRSSSAFGDRPTQQAAVQSFLKNYDKAIDALTQATRVQPVMPLFMLLGKTHMKAKQFKEGADSFERALQLMRPWQQRDSWPAEAAEAHFLCGMCHMEMRSYLSALNAFNSAISHNSNYAEAFYQRGLACMKLKQSKGIQDFNRALAINPNIFQAYLSRACYYGLKGVYTKAILNCNEAIRLQPNSLRAFLYRGALKYHIKAYDLAILDLTRATNIDRSCPLPYFNRAVCYQQQKQYAQALADYGIVLLLGEQLSLRVLINRGLLYFEQGEYLNALFDFQMAAKLSPVDHRIHHTLGLCFHKLGQLQQAVSTLSLALNIKAFFLDGFIARGNVYMDFGTELGIMWARRDYERALHLQPLCLAARVNLAYTQQVSGRLMQAWRNFTIAISINGSFKPALEGRAIVNLQMSNTFAAFQDISSSIHLKPSAQLLTNRGVINQFMQDSVSAMRDYQKAIQLDPTYSLAYFNAANVYFQSRHFAQALNYYDKAIQYNGKDESAFLNRAITKVLLRDSKSALQDFRSAIKLSPHSAHIYFNRANLYSAMGDFQKAQRDYTKALMLQPDDPLTLKRRADVYGKLGRREEAILDYQRAIDIQSRPHRIVAALPPQLPSLPSAKPALSV